MYKPPVVKDELRKYEIQYAFDFITFSCRALHTLTYAPALFYTSSGIRGLTILRSDSMILCVIYGVSDISCFSDLPELFTRNQVPDAS